MGTSPLALLGLAFVVACSSGDDNGKSGSGGSSATGGSGGSGGASGSGGAGGAAGSGGGIQSGTEITLGDGVVKGQVVGSTRVFRGIPYAEPPVGPLRWKPPQKKQPWSTPKDATQPGPKCPQFELMSSVISGNEDCLTVDVWAPEPAPTQPLPVMVWIHGGGFTSGAGTASEFEGAKLVPAGNIVQVNINYRLGPLGFLAHSGLTSEDAAHPTSGNFGFEDQQLGLAWVKANVNAFGGDPANVTIFGESAGGMSVCLHLVAPASQALYQRAIIESGPCEGFETTLAQAEKQGDDFAKALGCSDLACLRGKTSDDVLKALPLKKAFFFGTGASWGPNVDGKVLPKAPATLVAEGSLAKVPVVLGTNADEGDLFTLLGGLNGIDEATYTTMITAMGAQLGLDSAQVLAKYPASGYASPAAALAAVMTDGAFVCPTRRLARALVSHGAPAYLYHFTRAITLLGATKAFHAAEIPFVFGNSLAGFTPAGQELELSKTMMGYWTRFAASANPNGAGAV